MPDTNAGEAAGSPRSWIRSAHPISLDAATVCGASGDFLGSGTRPPAWPDLSMDLEPICCGVVSPVLSVVTTVLGITNWNSNIIPGAYPVTTNTASNWSYYVYDCMTSVVGFAGYLQVDLMAAAGPTGTGDYLTDFQLCDFDGYAPAMFDSDYSYFFDPTYNAYGFASYPMTWTRTGGPGGGHIIAYGLVVSDDAGMVCYWGTFAGGLNFLAPGDYLTFSISMEFPATYP